MVYNFWMDLYVKIDLLVIFGEFFRQLFKLICVTDAMSHFINNHWMLLEDVIVINHNILHTPSNVSVMPRKHFPIHQMKPCQLDWQKLVI